MKQYADLLQGRIFSYKSDIKLKSENDSIFWWESNQIWGWISKESVLEVINLVPTTIEEKSSRESLVNMCNMLRMSADREVADFYYGGITVAEYIGLKI